MTTKSKCIGQGNVNFTFLCFVESEIKVIVYVLVIVTFFVVDSRRNDTIFDSKNT